MKRRATGLLVAMAVAFVALALVGADSGWTAYARAAVEGSLVGGLADWFAVTALFRHPLGVPIPHTAVIPARKDQFGRTLGDFVQENFLGPDVITARLRSSEVVARAAKWLAQRGNAEVVARHAAELVVGLADSVHDDYLRGAFEEEIQRAVGSVALAPLGGRFLRIMAEQGRHQEIFGSALRQAERFLEDNRPLLQDRFTQESPWWLPEAIEHRIFDRLLDGVCHLLHDIDTNPRHEARRQVDAWVQGLVVRLEHSPELRERGEALKDELLSHPDLRQWTSSLWTNLKTSLRSQAAEPDSALRNRLADVVTAVGERLRDDPAALERLEELVDSGVGYVAEHFREDIAGLVSGTIARWEAHETSRKLELLLGRDLQFIRINGTVVGGLAGLLIHAIADAVG